jgi:uncharacterized membrane protein
MIPGTYDFDIYEGATFAETWTRSGVSTAVGWSAAIDIRKSATSNSQLYLALTSSDGITLSSNGTTLSMAVVISATRAAALAAAIRAAGLTEAYYDLKLTKPDATIEYLLAGKITPSYRLTP